MARQKIDEKIPDKSTPWENYLGARVEEYLKEQLDTKSGCFYNDSSNNRVLVFADEENRDLYLEDPTVHSSLLIAALDIPSEYSASIDLLSETYVAILSGAKGQYIEFAFDVVNRQGASAGDDINCTYTFKRGSNKRTVNARYSAGTTVSFNIDNYLLEGTNTITIAITGVNTLAATTMAITYKVINLALSDNFDISATHGSSDIISIPYTIKGSGMKYMEWYVDGAKQPSVPSEDEIADVETSRTKYLTLNNMTSGVHHLQFRAYVIDNEERFYSQIMYREFFVVDGTEDAPMVAVKGSIADGENGIVAVGERIIFDDLVQYVPYDIVFSVYNPSRGTTPTSILLDSTVLTTVEVENGRVTTYTISPMSSGSHSITFEAENTSVEYDAEIAETTMDIHEITDNLVLDFNATGRTNAGSHEWSYGDYTGTLDGFKWNESSGFVNNRLIISDGASFGIDLAPFAGNIKSTGLTFECEFATTNVSDDDAEILNLMTNGVGLKLTASEASLSSSIWKTSADSEKRALKTKFKSGERLRISYVINPFSGVDNHGLVFIYINGRVSGARAYVNADSFASESEILFQGSANAVIELRQLRIYNTALSSANILNNYILYRDTLLDMLDIYDHNDVLVEDTTSFDPDKLANAMPVMLFTGDIPALENEYQDKKKQVVVNVEYINMQDPTKSFTMTNATLTPQGTSSMAYPKKNFRLYTRKYTHAVVLDYEGHEIVDGLYSFKDGAQPVNCWCLKTDYAESSSSHNTGVARLWNKCLYDAKVTYSATDASHSVSNEYVLRTEAQRAALEHGYPYDVRTCVDGFPIMCFYRPTPDADYIFIGKYNFNNDKSTESVFGFKDIEGFDNTDMQCWEILDNSNELALFQTVTGFDDGWEAAFEARYPDDGSDADTTDLKAFCTWISGYADAEAGDTDFASEKWEHLDVYKVAAYYCYLMVFGAVDQTTKNAMLTSEDGDHFYYINYDNDTILGVRNDGILAFPPTIDRQSLDTSYEGITVYAYAGHENTLWNMLEGDTEFMAIVKAVYASLYSVGMNYASIIDMFDNKQSLLWCERVFNQDADYKYLTPYRDAGTDHLEMLQGARSAHRRWWVSKRLALMDSKFVAGEFASNIFQFKVSNGTPANKTFSIVAGADLYYGWGINSVIYDSGRYLETGDRHTYLVNRGLAIGDPVSIYAGIYLREVDIHDYLPYLTQVEMTTVYSSATDTTNLKKVVIGDSSSINTSLSGLSGLASAKKLEYLDIRGCAGMTTLNLEGNKYVSTLLAERSHLGSIDFADGTYIETLSLPSTISSLVINGGVYLTSEGLTFEDDYGKNISTIRLRGCTGLSDAWETWLAWFENKTTDDSDCTVEIDSIDWENVEADDLIAFGGIASLSLKGKILLNGSIDAEQVEAMQSIFGVNCFDSDNDLWIRTEEDFVSLVGDSSITEGETRQYRLVVVSSKTGYIKYVISGAGGHMASIDEDTGVFITTETGAATDVVNVYGRFYYGDEMLQSYIPVTILKATYPTVDDVSITGPSRLLSETTNFSRVISGAYTGITTGSWSLSGDIASHATVVGNDSDCIVTLDDMSLLYSKGTLSYTFYKTIGGTTTAIGTVTKNIIVYSDSLAVVRDTNGPIMTSFWNAYGEGGSQVSGRGQKIANQDYITKAEAASFLSADLNPSGSATQHIFYAQRNNITHFEEIQYFTGLVALPAHCFNACAKLTTITLPSSITSLSAGNVFNGCSALTYFEGPNVKSLGTNTFINCSSLVTIKLPECTSFGTTAIGTGTRALKELYTPKLATGSSYMLAANGAVGGSNVRWTVGPLSGTQTYALRGQSQLGWTLIMSKYCNVDIPNIWHSDDTNGICQKFAAFEVDPENTIFDIRNRCVVKVSNNAVMAIPYVGEINIPDTVSIISENAGKGSTQITSVTIPSSVTSIGANAFNGCVGLKTINLDASGDVQNSTFTGCTAVETLHIGSHFTMSSSNFAQSLYHAGHGTITSLTVDSGNPILTVDGNCLIYNGTTIRLGINNATIPNYVTAIGSYAFAHCVVTLSEIRSGLTLYSYTFSYTKFNAGGTLTVGPGVIIGGAHTFDNASGVTTLYDHISHPNDTNVGYTYYRMTSLKTLHLMSTVSGIGYNTFSYCTNVETIYIHRSTAPTLSSSWSGFGTNNASIGYNFRNTGNNTLYVPSGATGYSGGDWDSVVFSSSCGGFHLVYDPEL